MAVAEQQTLEKRAKMQIVQIKGYKNLVFQMEQQEANFPAPSPSIAYRRSLKKGELEERALTLAASLLVSCETAKGALRRFYKDLIKAHLAKEEWWETLFRYARRTALEVKKTLKRAMKVAKKLNSHDRENLLNMAKCGLGIGLVASVWPIVGVASKVIFGIGSLLTAVLGWQVTMFATAILALLAADNRFVRGAYDWTAAGLKSGSELLPRLHLLWIETA